ncbi:MAG: RIO-like serine/threonine protein kinase [Pirellulaceae bacterium]|jgi:RIO-like serine/threonine protein kinase
MSPHDFSIDDNLSVADEQQLVSLLDEFEAEIRSGSGPQIESFRSRVDEKLHKSLLYDLIRIEQEILPASQRSTSEQYQGRFPNDRPLIISALRRDHVVQSVGVNTTMQWDQSRVQVDLAVQTQPSLVAETAELLRTRLRTVALIVVVAFAIFLVRGLFFSGSQIIAVRAMTLLISAFCLWRLSISRTEMIGLWRILELILILAVAVQTASLQVVQMTRASIINDPVGVNVAMLFAFTTWTVANMVYAIFIPNTWRRAACVLVPTATIPLAVSVVLSSTNEAVQTTVRWEWLIAASILTYVATAAAVTGAYTVHSLRQQLVTARRFGQYRLKKRIGSGGMGEVYLAEHQMLKRPSAIKLIRPGFDTAAEAVVRFEREVQATASLAHWNTVEIFDYGRTEDGTFYYVMEYLEGESLQQLVERTGPLSAPRVVHFVTQVCNALIEAHSAGLIHQDIKPANIFAAKCSSRHDVAKLLDFGLVQEVKVTGDSNSPKPMGKGRVIGTPRFMSPEQAKGTEQTDVRSDIYSLGATAYFLLTGKPVFMHDTVYGLIKAHTDEVPLPPSHWQLNIPDDLQRIVLKCLEKEPDQRFASAKALEDALLACECQNQWTEKLAAEWWVTAGAKEPTTQ